MNEEAPWAHAPRRPSLPLDVAPSGIAVVRGCRADASVPPASCATVNWYRTCSDERRSVNDELKSNRRTETKP